MRVLHIHSGNLYGGVETTLLAQARHRDPELDMEMHTALCFAGRFSEELTKAKASVHFLGGVQVRKPWSVRRVRQNLRDLLHRRPFDVVVTHSCWSQAIFGPVIKSRKLPLVFWLHDAARGRHWSEQLARRTNPELVLCNSRFTLSTVSNLYPNAPCEVVYPPYTPSELNETAAPRDAIRKQFNTPSDAVVIVQVSRIEELKGHQTHLRALCLLREMPQWIYWLVGAPQRPSERKYFQYLKTLAAELGISNRVRFMGERADVALLLPAADVFCQPNSIPESFGLTFIEALNARLPLVSTSIGGGREIVGDHYGVLVPPNNSEALAEALRKLIESPNLRRQLGERGPARARELCDVTSQMRRLKNALANLTGDCERECHSRSFAA